MIHHLSFPMIISNDELHTRFLCLHGSLFERLADGLNGLLSMIPVLLRSVFDGHRHLDADVTVRRGRVFGRHVAGHVFDAVILLEYAALLQRPVPRRHGIATALAYVNQTRLAHAQQRLQLRENRLMRWVVQRAGQQLDISFHC